MSAIPRASDFVGRNDAPPGSEGPGVRSEGFRPRFAGLARPRAATTFAWNFGVRSTLQRRGCDRRKGTPLSRVKSVERLLLRWLACAGLVAALANGAASAQSTQAPAASPPPSAQGTTT